MQAVQASRGGGASSFAPLAGVGGNAGNAGPRLGPAQWSDAGEQKLLTDLSMYNDPPAENITLEEFERTALARLSGEVERCAESLCARGRPEHSACVCCALGDLAFKRLAQAHKCAGQWAVECVCCVPGLGSGGWMRALPNCSGRAVLKELEAYKLRHSGKTDKDLQVRRW
jgi:hypothetical protein